MKRELSITLFSILLAACDSGNDRDEITAPKPSAINAIAAAPAPAPPIPAANPYGAWIIERQVDEMNDKVSWFASNKEEGGSTFTLMCYGGRPTTSYIVAAKGSKFGPAVESSQPDLLRPFKYRIDKKLAKSASAGIDRQFLNFRSNPSVDNDIMNALQKGDTLLVRVKGEDSLPITMQFKTVGAAKTLEKLKAECDKLLSDAG